MILPAPLVLLIGLRFRATWRRFVRSLGTVRGLLLTFGAVLAGVTMFVPIIVRAVRSDATLAGLADGATPYVPFAILAFLVLSLVRTRSDQWLAFLQSEVDLLFPAPFTRRQLLAYKLAQRAVPLLFVSFFFSIWAGTYAHSWLAAWLGIALTLWFLHLAGLCLALLGQAVESRRYARARRGVAVALLAAVAAGSWWAGRSLEAIDAVAMFKAFAHSPLAAYVTSPVLPFARVFSARAFLTEALPWAGLALAINGCLAWLAMRIDADWLEASAESSRKLNERIEEMRRSGGAWTGGASLVGVALPMPPRLRGAGPLVWRQTIAGMRRGGRGLLFVALMVASVSLPMLLTARANANWSEKSGPIFGFLVAYLSLWLPSFLRLDFRGDIDRMDILKSLPIDPSIVAAAQIFTPATLVTLVQVPIGLLLAILFSWRVEALPLWCVALYGANLLIASVENAMFLLWPVRPKQGVGMSFAGAQVVLQIGRMIAISLLLGAAAGAGGVVYALAGENAWSALACATIVIGLEVAAGFAVVGRLFDRFDPSHERVADA
ncbi:MAG: putative ABC exporter domain-containing protein [Phycisphaerales bacterium]